MSTNAPQRLDRPFNGMPLVRPTVSPSPASPAKQMGTVRIELGGLPELKEALGQAAARIQDLESINKGLDAENKKLRKALEDANDALATWQAVVRVAREKDSTLPDPESSI